MTRYKCFLLVDTFETLTTKTEWGLRTETIYRRKDTGEKATLNHFGIGAIWEAEWYNDIPWLTGVDGHSYVVRTPGGDWCIDSRASNCGLPDDEVHKCWVT